MPSLLSALALLVVTSTSARVSLDLKDAPVEQILRVLGEAGDLQIVLDPGIQCSLTLRLKEIPIGSALEAVLSACSLAIEGENRIARVTTVARMAAEAHDAAALRDARAQNEKHQLVAIHLSYAKAAEIAPLLGRILAPRGSVSFDSRTNILLLEVR
jgi:type II secretory pathway component HofQ